MELQLLYNSNIKLSTFLTDVSLLYFLEKSSVLKETSGIFFIKNEINFSQNLTVLKFQQDWFIYLLSWKLFLDTDDVNILTPVSNFVYFIFKFSLEANDVNTMTQIVTLERHLKFLLLYGYMYK